MTTSAEENVPWYIIALRVSILLLLCLAGLALLASPFVSVSWYQSCRQARVYNALHQAHFTCGDFFWAGDQINAQTQTVHLQ